MTHAMTHGHMGIHVFGVKKFEIHVTRNDKDCSYFCLT
jgi:hypothetical protein